MVNYFDKEIVFFKENFNRQEEILKCLSKELKEKDLVTDKYYANVLEREKKFPTGLFINGIGVAIPHTDSIYVKKSQIAFMSLEKPVTFFEMGSNDREVDVNLIFMLALKEPHEQLSILQNLIDMFQKDGTLKSLKNITMKNQFFELIHDNNLN